MAEAAVLGAVYLALLGIAWLIAMIIAVAIAWRLQSTLAKTGIVLAAVGSLPAFLVLSQAFEHYLVNSNFRSRMAIAKLESTRYQELCTEPQQLTVYKTLPVRTVDIRIKEAPDPSPLDVMNPVWPKKDICWTKASPDACASTRIANIQWEFKSRGSWCAVSDPAKECHMMWNFSVPTQVLSEISSMTATTTLETSRVERISPLIERFRVSIYEGGSSTLLGETSVYRKSWFGDLGRDPKEEAEPRHCPDRDAAIGKLLELVFASGG